MIKVSGIYLVLVIWALLGGSLSASGQSRRFPPPDFDSGYVMPETQTPASESVFYDYLAVAVLGCALGLGVYFIYKRRSRKAAWGLMIFSLAFFGFWRAGCVCPVGAVQNVSLSVADGGYAVPAAVLLMFLLPLVLSLFYGRIFCGTVCPLGAIQDVVLVRPVSVPGWLESSLRLGAYLWLGLGVMLAVLGAGFVICRYDPFVSFFRLSGSFGALMLGGAFLGVGLFVGRPYCRFLCPYGVLLRQFSSISRWKVSISPDKCISCRLCEDSCPFGAINKPTGKASDEEIDGRRKVLAGLLVALPVMVLLSGWLGSLSSGWLGRLHGDVELAQRVYLEQANLVEGTTDQSDAFWGTGESVESLYERSAAIQGRFNIGGWVLGGIMALVVFGGLVKHTIRRNSDEYTADKSGCLACGRCFQACPRERLARQKESESKQVVYV